MKSNTLAILILAYCILVACTRTSPNAQLVQADSLMQKFPDSALRFLQKIRPEELNSLEDRAYHALLLTEVKDKNFIQQTEDSQIRIAVQYYDSIKDIPMQAKSIIIGEYSKRSKQSSGSFKEIFHSHYSMPKAFLTIN